MDKTPSLSEKINWIKETKEQPNHIFLLVYIQPQAKENKIVGEFDGLLKIKIKAPAVENLANEELLEFLAKKIGIKNQQINLIKGDTSRRKTLIIESSKAEILKKLTT